MDTPIRMKEALLKLRTIAAVFGLNPWDWAGTDLVSDWFRRNMRIYTNIVRLIDSAEERVLVIYGAGHIGWLQFAFEGDPAVRVRKLSEFVNQA